MLVTAASHSRVRKSRASAGAIVPAVIPAPSGVTARARSMADVTAGGLDRVDRFALTSRTLAGSTGSDFSPGPAAEVTPAG